MSDNYASGNWHVSPGSADEFIVRWREFLGWTRDEHPGLRSAALIRAQHDPDRFVSFATWASVDARDAWKNSDGFMERFSACRELCDDFTGGDYDHVVTI
jgi:heme-degrading monooxygenase HmoA